MGPPTDATPERDEGNNVALKIVVQRQLMLLDFQTPETERGPRAWPVLTGLSTRQSACMFAMLERWGWIAGSPCDSDDSKCIITARGAARLEKIKNGQPLIDATDLKFAAEDRRILEDSDPNKETGSGGSALRILRRGFVQWMTRVACSRSGLWVILCAGITLIAVGVHPRSTGSLSFETWQTVLVMVGAGLVVCGLRLAYRNVERSRPLWGWLPAGIAALLFVPLSWALFDGLLGTWWFVGSSAAIGAAGCPIPPRILKLLPESTVRRSTSPGKRPPAA